MITLEKLTIQNCLYIAENIRQSDADEWLALSGQKDFDYQALALACYSSNDCGWTGAEAGNARFVAGFSAVRLGVYRTWMLAHYLSWEACGKEMTEVVAASIGSMLANDGVRRIETVCLAKNARARRWYDRLGLLYESTMRAYASNGEDAVMYVATK